MLADNRMALNQARVVRVSPIGNREAPLWNLWLLPLADSNC